jgi:hypothetical protein
MLDMKQFIVLTRQSYMQGASLAVKIARKEGELKRRRKQTKGKRGKEKA